MIEIMLVSLSVSCVIAYLLIFVLMKQVKELRECCNARAFHTDKRFNDIETKQSKQTRYLESEGLPPGIKRNF